MNYLILTKVFRGVRKLFTKCNAGYDHFWTKDLLVTVLHVLYCDDCISAISGIGLKIRYFISISRQGHQAIKLHNSWLNSLWIIALYELKNFDQGFVCNWNCLNLHARAFFSQVGEGDLKGGRRKRIPACNIWLLLCLLILYLS